MSRYNEISQYFNDDNSANMDVERYINITKMSISIDLEIIEEDDEEEIPSSSNLFFLNNSKTFLYFYIWNFYFKKKIDNNSLCTSMAFDAMGLFCGYFEQPDNVHIFDELLYNQGIPLLLQIATHQIDIARRCYPLFIEGLQNFEAGRARHLLPQKMIVLAVEMLASEHKQTVDWQSHGIPVERFYYDFVKEALYSQDEAVLKEWLTALCDNHLKWSARTEATEDEYALNGYEIERQELLLWPFEYQAVKNFRAAHGLTTPEIEHPLLKTPLATEHRADFSKWNAPDWFYPLVDKLISVNPQLDFTRELFK
ncbi:hypothetical protein [Klebsiella spallanzanii]|uniref:hypothetical protein n=1 Tax=Klebsiella spallanzanii TaxID=2587528 RepID=UPI001157C15B|nr:hypothetical protein [Klebsiella spallanzanii]VUS79503.1 hypothetical protein SB6419_01167 [Klebsiella spallanzanii]